MADRYQSQVNLEFAGELATVKTELMLTMSVLNVMEKAISSTLEDLAKRQLIAPEVAYLSEYKTAIRKLRAQGFHAEHEEATVECPQCKARLRVAGEKGDRCTWCGYEFSLKCPGCKRELRNVEGRPGDHCLWCQYEF